MWGIWNLFNLHNVVVGYIQESYQNDPFRIFLELLLVVFTVIYLTYKKYDPEIVHEKLTEEEIEQLIEDWAPESLAPETVTSLAKWNLESIPKILGQMGLAVELEGHGKCHNLSAFNFLGIANDAHVKEKVGKAIVKYGVGTCGPPGFYGTLDLHLELEESLARFLGVEASIIYSQGFSAVSSTIPAFSKRNDIIICDNRVNFAIQKGVAISKSIVFYFEHNNMTSLESVLKYVHELYEHRPLTRRFIIVEGIYINTGSICDLVRILELKEKYKYRLIIDESLSLAVLGDRGRGISEYYNVDVARMDIIVGSFSYGFSSCGGFCAGSQIVVDHQRLSAQSYCFSASSPALITTNTLENIRLVAERGDRLIAQLKRNIRVFIEEITADNFVRLVHHGDSPIIHLYLTIGETFVNEAKILQEIVDEAKTRKVLLTRAKYVDVQEILPIQPSIRLCISAGFSTQKIAELAKIVSLAISQVGSRHQLVH